MRYPQRVKRVLFRTYAVCHIVKRRDRLRAVHIGQEENSVRGHRNAQSRAHKRLGTRVGTAQRRKVQHPVLGRVDDVPVVCGVYACLVGRDLDLRTRFRDSGRRGAKKHRRYRDERGDCDRADSEMPCPCHRTYYTTRSRAGQAF